MTVTLNEPDGTSIVFGAELRASIDCLTTEMKRRNDRLRQIAQGIHTFTIPPMPMTISASAGTLYLPNITGPQMGNFWDVHRISCTGFSAGTVNVWLNQQNAELLAVFATAGVLLNGKAQILIGGNDSLYFTGSSITAASGFVTISLSGVEIAAPLIGDYLI